MSMSHSRGALAELGFANIAFHALTNLARTGCQWIYQTSSVDQNQNNMTTTREEQPTKGS